MSCTGPCKQGRKPCPAPEACENPLFDPGLDLVAVMFMYVLGVVTGAMLAWIFG